MGNAQGGGFPEDDGKKKSEKKEDKKSRGLPPPPHGRRKRKNKGVSGVTKMPTGKRLLLSVSECFLVTPSTRCALRKLRLERIKDFLLLEEEVRVDSSQFNVEFIFIMIYQEGCLNGGC